MVALSLSVALVAAAYMLGWVPLKAAPAPGSMAAPGQQVTGTAPGVALLPGETLIDNPESPKPEAPQAPAPAIAPPAIKPPTPQPLPGRPAQQANRPQPSTPSFAKQMPSRAAPSAPTYLREEPAEPRAPRSYERSLRGVCVNCGTIASIVSQGGDWEVRVRFEDGSSQALRYPERPPLRVGERVHLEDGRLLPD